MPVFIKFLIMKPSHSKMMVVPLVLFFLCELVHGLDQNVLSIASPKPSVYVQNNSTFATESITTGNATAEGSAYDYDDEDFEEFAEKLVKEQIQVEFHRRFPEIRQLQQKEILQNDMENGRCKNESFSHNYYDPRISGCRQCSNTCPTQDYLCIEKCESYRVESHLTNKIEDLEKQTQREREDLQKQIHSLLAVYIVSLFIGIIFGGGAIYYIWRLRQNFNEKLRILQNKIDQAQSFADTRFRQEEEPFV